MKCEPFDKKTYNSLEYILHHINATSTYWCKDMMKMILYLTDLYALECQGEQVTSLEWEITSNSLEAKGLEGLEHWESFVKKPRRFFHKPSLEEYQTCALQKAIQKKQEPDYRVGSFSFRNLILSRSKDLQNEKLPVPYHNVVRVLPPEPQLSQTN